MYKYNDLKGKFSSDDIRTIENRISDEISSEIQKFIKEEDATILFQDEEVILVQTKTEVVKIDLGRHKIGDKYISDLLGFANKPGEFVDEREFVYRLYMQGDCDRCPAYGGVCFCNCSYVC